MHENTIHLWKKKYGSLGTPEIREMNELRDENTRLKQMDAISRTRGMAYEIMSLLGEAESVADFATMF